MRQGKTPAVQINWTDQEVSQNYLQISFASLSFLKYKLCNL